MRTRIIIFTGVLLSMFLMMACQSESDITPLMVLAADNNTYTYNIP